MISPKTLLKRLLLRNVLFFITLIPLTGCSKHPAPAEDKSESEAPPVAVEIAKAEMHDVETTVLAQGTVVFGQGESAHVSPVSAGRLREVRVREGDRVHAGQIIAILDNRTQLAAARSAAAALNASSAQARQSELTAQSAALDQTNAVNLARLMVDSARLDRDNSVKQAQTALRLAETDLQRIRVGARPQEIAQVQQALAQAQSTRDRAAAELDRVQFLYDKGIAAKRQLDDAQTAASIAKSAAESAAQQLSLLKSGARQEDLNAAELRVEQAREAIAQAKTSGAAKTAQMQSALRQAEQSAGQVAAKQQEVEAMRASVAQKRADFTGAQETASLAELRAPLDGTVTRRNLNPGDMADPTAPVIEIASSRTLNLVANISADDGNSVRVGMSARISTLSSAANNSFFGKVLSVGQIDPQTNLLSVRLSVNDPNGLLKAGTFATAKIVLRTDRNAVTIPKQAVITHDTRCVVFTVDDASLAHEREVKIGAEQGEQVEILSGVKAGESVIRLGQYELAEGAKVRDAGKAEKP